MSDDGRMEPAHTHGPNCRCDPTLTGMDARTPSAGAPAKTQFVAGVTPAPDAAFTIDLHGCARCHGAGHPELVFRPLTHPVEGLAGAVVASHWAPCPTNGEPILLTVTT